MGVCNYITIKVSSVAVAQGEEATMVAAAVFNDVLYSPQEGGGAG